MWDPTTYLRYSDERSRPFGELVARIGATAPRAVVDLGCGPGTLTVGLAERWPAAHIHGIDSSAEMVAAADALGSKVATFAVGDVREWTPAADADVVVANAVLHWVPGHEELLRRWPARLPAGAYLAVQVPGNFDAPSHRLLRTVLDRGGLRDRVGDGVRDPASVLDPTGYAQLLTAAGCAVDAWETTYTHLLPADGTAEHPVLRWLDGTALRPVRAALTDDEWAAFRAALGAELAAAYPARSGLVYFPFRRVFVVARTPQ